MSILFNNDLRPIETKLFLSKLSALLERLRVQYQSGQYNTQEEIIAEFSRALDKFYSSARTPFLALRPAEEGEVPSIDDYNDCFEEVGWDLSISFAELETLEKTVLRNFNYMVSERDKLNKLVKQISSKAGDYVLYSEDPLGDVIYFKDSFSDVSKIDLDSSLLSKPQCDISQAEGIVTLPVIREGPPTDKKADVQINAVSNGTAGNYREVGAEAYHDKLADILDGNPYTWFEYERVQTTKEENTEALKLDLTLYFDTPQIINFIKINPNNFGTQIPVSIQAIDTSLDRKTRISIKDDIPIADFLQEDEKDVFSLAPSTSKYAGQGLYTFTPRKVKYVHVLLEQATPCPITTTSGLKWRYAIGVRDIELHALRFQSEGDIVSLPFTSTREIQKVSLLASENPLQVSELADIKHQVSPDDGATWYDIQPQDRIGTEIPEILEFNTNSENAIPTASAVYSLRHRMLFNRNADKFTSGSSTFRQEVKKGADILGVPSLSPLSLNLSRPSVTGTVALMNPLWGARAWDGKIATHKHIVGRSTGIAGMRFQLPDNIKELLVSGDLTRDEIVVWIDNDPGWERVGDLNGEATTAEKYALSINGELLFGKDSDGAAAGKVPNAGSYIGITFKEEDLALSASSPYACELIFPTDGDKENVSIYRTDSTVEGNTLDLKPGALIHRLPHKNIVSPLNPDAFDPDPGDAFQVLVTKESDLDLAGEYYVDYENGIIRTITETSSSATTTVTYDYVPKVELSIDQWDFVESADNVYQKIAIKDEGYSNYSCLETKGTEDDLTASSRVTSLTYSPVVPRTIVFSKDKPFTGDGVNGAAPVEVAYIDGVQEFDKEDANINLDGYYSVDYKNGIIYVSPDDTFGDDPGTVNYQYTNFQAVYNIARMVDPKEFTVASDGQSVSISEKETLKVWGQKDSDIRHDALLKAQYDYVASTRESIEELEPFFSPICRHIVYKILPKGRI